LAEVVAVAPAVARRRKKRRRERRRKGGGRCGSSKVLPEESLAETDARELVGYETIAINYALLFYSIQQFLAVWEE
jgi:hypothetical protein